MEIAQGLLRTLGWLWLGAVALNFFATLSESWGAFRLKEDREKRIGFAAFVVWTAALLAPGLLLLHGFVITASAAPDLIIPAVICVVFSIFGGTLLGWAFGAALPKAASFFHDAAGPVSFAAVVAALVAAWPSVPIAVSFISGLVSP